MASTGERRPALDGVRGLAILFVVLGHAMLNAFGYGGIVGVTLFFVLSGYLITGLLLREATRTGRVDFVAFYLRRARRLLPALLFVVALAPVVLWAAGDPRLDGYSRQAVVAVLYVGSILRADGFDLGTLGHTWSLSVEELFYLSWPLVVLWLVRRWSPSTVARVAWGLAAFAVLWRVAAAWALPYDRVYFAPDTNAFGLLLGAALAVSIHAGWRRTSRGGAYAALVGLVVLAAWPTPGWWNESYIAYGAPIVGLLGLALVANSEAMTAGLLCHPALRWFGTISYGWYLWHQVLVNIRPGGFMLPADARLVLAAVSLVIAWLSWRYVERPWLAQRVERGRRLPGRILGGDPVSR